MASCCPSMRNRSALAFVIGSIFTFAMLVPALANPGQTWTQYRNDRYGFTLEYPSDLFEVERTTEAGDGTVFIAAKDDARLLVGALVNDHGFDPESYKQYIARKSYAEYRISYRPMGGSWFVLSGDTQTRMFYEKVMFSCGGRLINSFALVYPIEQRHIYDPVIERIEDSFRPGRRCGQS